jgi:hypothetical protein
MDDNCFPLRIEMLEASAKLLLARAHIDPIAPPPLVGTKWTGRFQDRYPEYHVRIQEALDILRHRAQQSAFARAWFEKLRKVFAEFGICIRHCYNMDETGFCIGAGGKQCVITGNINDRCVAPCSTNCDFVRLSSASARNNRLFLPLLFFLTRMC